MTTTEARANLLAFLIEHQGELSDGAYAEYLGISKSTLQATKGGHRRVGLRVAEAVASRFPEARSLVWAAMIGVEK